MRKEELPYVILKYASTINGIIGSNNDQRLILSNDLDRRRVMEIRAGVDAILIGAGTLISDDPQLTIRDKDLVEKRVQKGLSPQPIRVVLSKGKLQNHNYNLFTDKLSETVLFTDQIDPSVSAEVKQILNKKENPQVLNALSTLKEMGVNSVLIEGGAKIISEVLSLGVANEIRILYSPQVIAKGKKVPILEDISLNIVEKKIEHLGDQFAVSLKLRR